MSKTYEIVPVPTRILTIHDDIVEAINEYGKDKIGPNDVICVAESVVAITQGRVRRPETIKPTFFSRILSPLFPPFGSISNWHSMQALIECEGKWRIFFAVLAGAVAKCVGIAGVFYRLGGEQARLIDDATGTMPPYDKHIVYGPTEPFKVAERIANSTGAFGAAVADVNDLKRSCVLGVSNGVDSDEVARILLDNPFGNASQKTPIVIIKNYRKN
ncbi:MAG TPA: coenzyme F420-0:L-glutamate ligase [Candidatus Avacidaminococcus intestinavium]|uniref:Coenzyme F420-0:L-glutamate ligase n=1 Tax=Candidatus Avacidaminococcus intestinavium TaxID=2840684 RepID=A0A9D1MPQ1_9FIRM|nr:coenzyme F420-0:L-glutamate ligase [Candidatus Avacidaminococcus intestinavium]